MNKYTTYLKKNGKLIFSKLPKKTQRNLSMLRGMKSPLELYKNLKKLNTNFSQSLSLDKEQKHIWEEAFKKNLWITPENIEIVKSFTTSRVELIQTSTNKLLDNNLIVICVVKNDLERMKMFYDHYRYIGIKHFVIIDNNSDDGTLEWLLKQTDSDIYLVKDKFHSRRKYGWINQILSMYGFNRWYLYADSDELFVFDGIENYGVKKIINYAEDNKIKRVATIMVDMYSDKGLFKSKSEKQNIKDEYIYFDSDTYSFSNSYKGLSVRGGPRKRVMSDDNENWLGPLLIKHPLFYLEKGNIFESAHYIFPFESNSFLGGALLHYKFIETDLKRYKEIAKEGNFAGGSKEYKQYMKSYENDSNLTFMYKGSIKYNNSSSLKNIPKIKKYINYTIE